jgi:hypothetical protein
MSSDFPHLTFTPNPSTPVPHLSSTHCLAAVAAPLRRGTGAAPASDQEAYRTPLRDYIPDAVTIVILLLMGTTSGCLIASNVEKKLARHCALSLQAIAR